MSDATLSVELTQPYNFQSLTEELNELVRRAYENEVTTVNINMEKIRITSDQEVVRICDTIKILRLMGRRVHLRNIQPATAVILTENSLSMEIS